MQDTLSSSSSSIGSNDGSLESSGSSSGSSFSGAALGTHESTSRQRLLVDFPGFSLHVTRHINFQSTFENDDEAVLYKHLCGFLDWRDAVALGSTNKTLRQLYLKHSHIILKRLLDILDGLVGSNKHIRCGEVHVPYSRRQCTCSYNVLEEDIQKLTLLWEWDPRYNSDYDSWKGHQQCAAMVDYLTMICENLRPHLRMDREDISDHSKLPDIIGRDLGDWLLESEDPRWRLIAASFPRRATMALNLALIHRVMESLAKGNDCFCTDAACGIGGLVDEPEIFEEDLEGKLIDMLPLDEDSMFQFMLNQVYPSVHKIMLLGKKLSRKIFLAAPIMDWVEVRTSEDFEAELASMNSYAALVVDTPPMERMTHADIIMTLLAHDDDDDAGDY